MTTFFYLHRHICNHFVYAFGIQGLSALQYVDLRSSRNLYIIGISLFFPLVLCQWMQKHSGAINTGIDELDSTLTVLLSTTILVGGCLGCLLDNLIPGLCDSNFRNKILFDSTIEIPTFVSSTIFPGTKEERGIIAWENEMSLESGDNNNSNTPTSSTFDFPFGMDVLRRYFQDNNFINTYISHEINFRYFFFFLQLSMDVICPLFANLQS